MENVVFQAYNICRKDRNMRNKHTSFVIWFTGLSGSGKSTIANLVEKELFEKNICSYVLDGDNIRTGLNKDLSFTAEGRKENLRRIAEVAKLFTDAGIIVIAVFISPLEKDRQLIREIIGANNIIEVFVNTSIAECERRDVKGLYKKARAGQIKNFTGISAPYEHPLNPDIEIKTEEENMEQSVKRVVDLVSKRF